MNTHSNAARRIEGLIEEGEAFTRSRAEPKRGPFLSSKRVLTVTAALYGIFGSAWLSVPDAMSKYWKIADGDGVNYMGHRYGAFMLGLVAAMWVVRNAPNTPARRAVVMGALVTTTLTTALSLYGALSLGLNAWPATLTEFAMGVSLVWVLLIKPEPVVCP